jgi:CBS domain containing-hemolysin-like protein
MSIRNRADPIPHRRARTQWAQSATGDETYGALEALTVRAIATKRADFETCAEDEMLSAVVERNRSNQFDFLPVIERTTEHIVGLIEIVAFMHGANADQHVSELMHPLSETNLIGADASILAFVRDADRQRCRLVVSRQEISGLVSLCLC